jgi:ADP-heptose:LPS heptosyltransferase
MGWGDEIIATGQVRAMQRLDPRPVLVIDRHARPRYSPIWNGNPHILRERKGEYQSLLNGPGARPYIEMKTDFRWVWRDNFRCEPGEIYLTAEERRFAERWRGRVLIEPNVKVKPEAANKRWVWSRWQTLVDFKLADMVQVGPAGTQLLIGVEHALTTDFRLACAVLSVCRAYVGTEGGLHHAAAALGVPAVVLFGGFISPKVTGYDSHRNLFRGGVACGSRKPCLHCRDAMLDISVDEVAKHLTEIT